MPPRRLPVLQSSAAEDEVAASRPRWHWVFIGAGLTVTLWAPLVAAATPVALRVAARALGRSADDLTRTPSAVTANEATVVAVVVAGALLLCFVAAAFCSGALVGRFGGRAGRVDAVLGAVLGAGVAAGGAFVAKAAISGPVGLAGAVALGVAGALGGGLGGSFGFRKRAVLGFRSS